MSATGTAAATSEVVYRAGQVIFREGDPSDRAYLIVSGRVEITKAGEEGALRIGVLKAGDLLGELGVLGDAPRSATARALEHTVLRALSARELLRALEGGGDQSLPLVRVLVGKLRSASDLLVDEAAREELLRPAPRTPGASLLRRLGGPFRRRRRSARQRIVEFLPDVVGLEERPAPFAARALLLAIVALVVAAVAWASMVEIDRVVTARGKLVSTGRHVLIQPLETSVVRAIEVGVGQTVRRGDRLAVLDPTFAEADLAAMQGLLASLDAQIARLRAELDGTAPERFSADPAEEALQRALYEDRRSTLEARARSLDAEVREVRAQQLSNERDLESLGAQLAVYEELVQMRRGLMERELSSRVQYLDALSQKLALEREVTQRANAAPELEQRHAALAAKLEGLGSEARAQAAEELQKVLRERDNLLEDLRKAERRKGLVELTAPADAVVLDVGRPAAVGSVIQQAEPLFTLLPLNAPLELLVEVTPQDIGRLRVGDPVRIKIDALPFQRHGTLDGGLRLISEDTFERDGPLGPTAAYRAWVTLEPAGFRDVPADFRLIPGMTATGEIQIGSRRLLSYFVYPVLRVLDESFREP
ncbi:MAG TPA: HlyD family type I secretion periplasmic adaptor subunit [Geminicoccaceae bacterium]|nr:HlyD family type I secretion periplasmic adaptor subunit [Geminicoccaceae bacterium]